jgi:putative hydrolase of the HAD superfamily
MIESMNSDTSLRAAIFDGDDTLWKTEILYDRAREAVRDIVIRQGVDPDQWEARQRVLDVGNVSVYGFSSARFPASCLQAFQEVRGASMHEIDENVERKIVYAARSVFRQSPELVSHVKDVLGTLRRRGLRLALLTKGDPQVQADRIQQSGLASFFDAIEVVPEKTSAIILKIVESLDVQPLNTWVIGNSMRSDILPALVLGARGIWIDAPVWEYERGHEVALGASVFKATDIRDVLPIIH